MSVQLLPRHKLELETDNQLGHLVKSSSDIPEASSAHNLAMRAVLTSQESILTSATVRSAAPSDASPQAVTGSLQVPRLHLTFVKHCRTRSEHLLFSAHRYRRVADTEPR